MPNIKRRFKDDDPSSEEEEEEVEPTYHPARGGGKALRMGGGKGFGKQLRPPPQDDDSDEDSDDDEDEEPQQPAYRSGGGKQLRPPVGKMLRPPPQDDDSDEDDDGDDDDDDDDMEEDEPVRPVQRGGGKSLMRMRAPSDDEDEDDDSDKEEEEAPPQRIVQRGGGKSLMRMQVNQQDDSDEDESSEEEEPTRVAPRSGGGKQLRPPPAGGGKQLRRGGGKQLRPAPADDDDDDDDDSDEEDETPQPVQVVRRSGGKSLMRMTAPDSDSDEDEEPSKAASMKEPDEKAAEDIEEDAAAPDEEESSDEDGMDVDSGDEEPKKEATPAPKATPKTKEPAVEESEDEESSDEEEAEFDNETFDPQKLVKDEEDQKYLDSLPELEREAILGERFEKRKADMDMKKALRDAKRKEREEKSAKDPKAGTKRKATTKAAAKKATPAKKKKATDTAEDETIAKSLAPKRGSTRNRDAKGSKAKKAEALAALREERKKVTRKDSSDSESSFGDDDDDDSDDDYEESGKVSLRPWQKKAAESRKSRLDQVEESDDEMEQADDKDDDDKYAGDTQRVVQEAELDDYLKITVSRRKLGRWCNEPFFKKAVVGCFAKLFIGENDQGKRCYRLCRIVDVQPAPKGSYALPAVKKEKPVVTDKALRLQFGKNERIFLIKLISDNKATETDVNLFKTEMKNQRQQVLSRKEANKIRRKQDSLVSNYTYTTEDIESNLRKRKKKGSAIANLGLEQTRAAIAVQGARAALEDALQQAKSGDGDSSAVGAAEKVLEEKLEEERRVLDSVKNRNERLTQRGTDKKWAKVNARALDMNQKLDRGALKDPEDQKIDSGAKPKFNPYARRKVKPKILWEVGQKEEEEEAEKVEASKAAAENAEKEPDSTPNLVQEQQQKAAALSQSHQFAIDEETLAQSSYTSGIAGLTAKKPVRKRVRKGLSLTEYLERKEAGSL
ncbi:MAG: hypothetical protein SGBAC_000240 [Bacillariaceae sp.]